MTHTLQSWRTACTPHRDIREGAGLETVRHSVAEGRCGYAVSEDALLQVGEQAVALDGYVGPPETPPPDTRLIRLHGAVSPMSLANVMKTAIALSKLGEEVSIDLNLSLELKGEVNEHSVQMAC